jgi:hypothetical protein
MMIPASLAAIALSFIVNGLPFTGTYLKGDLAPCAEAMRQAEAWKTAGNLAVTQQVGPWCTAGTVMDGQWVSVQWRASPQGTGSDGWYVSLPLAAGQRGSGTRPGAWGLDVLDPSIGTRLRMRRSLETLERHHQQSLLLLGADRPASPQRPRPVRADQDSILTQFENGALLLSLRLENEGSYSILIERRLNVSR